MSMLLLVRWRVMVSRKEREEGMEDELRRCADGFESSEGKAHSRTCARTQYNSNTE